MGKSQLTNIDIAVYALYRLGGLERRVHTEEVAKGCYDLAPERFSWELYPEYPAREPGRSSLFDARKPKNGALVTGDQVKGWMLTPEGVECLRASRARIERSLGERGPAKRLPKWRQAGGGPSARSVLAPLRRQDRSACRASVVRRS